MLMLWVAAIVVTFFIWGRNAALGVLTLGAFTSGVRFAKEQQDIKSAKAIEKRKKSDAKVNDLSNDRVHSDLDKWMRDTKR